MLVKVRRYPNFDFPSILDFGRDIDDVLGTFLQGEDVSRSRWTLPLDVVEEQNQYLIAAELPGVRKEDLRISVHDGLVTISAERKNTEIPENAVWLRNEISIGQFSRTLPLPGEVKVEDITAEISDGVLHLVLPKSEKARTREIKVK
jgi:HSP20 family protein